MEQGLAGDKGETSQAVSEERAGQVEKEDRHGPERGVVRARQEFSRSLASSFAGADSMEEQREVINGEVNNLGRPCGASEATVKILNEMGRHWKLFSRREG